ncbi:alpha/beta fold hydrolase [Streptomyces violaceusniger]|uniref:alpha/beta fold hydrolase n=1 Tax=Streptomyces violaceusniger TaxID=68280 RepID=UPI0009C3CDDF|nr:hypothetical protein [Streptomyces hygroscopicus]AQW49227.1 hydrolase [Streptomyces hygroscopicus]
MRVRRTGAAQHGQRLVDGDDQQRRTRRPTLPVPTLAGAENLGEAVGDTMRLAADDVESHVLPGCGHYPAEEVPEAMPAALTAFPAPYRDGSITP